MEIKEIVQYIENIATDALRQRYTFDESAHIAIEGINLVFNGESDYKIIARCCIKNITAVFELDSAIGLPNNPYYFNEKEAYAYAIHLANVAVKVHNSHEMDNQDVDYDPSEPHGVC